MKKKWKKLRLLAVKISPIQLSMKIQAMLQFFPSESYSRPFIVYIATENVTLFSDTVSNEQREYLIPKSLLLAILKLFKLLMLFPSFVL